MQVAAATSRTVYARLIAQFSAVLVAIVGGVIMAGWWLNLKPLRCLFLGCEPMKPTIGLALFLCGASLALISRSQVNWRMRRFAGAFALIVFCLATVIFGEAIFGFDFRIDQLLAFGHPAPTQDWQWRMMPGTAFSFLVISFALLLAAQARTRARLWLISGLSASQLIPAVIALAGFFVEQILHGRWNLMGMTTVGVPVAITFVLLSAGLLAHLHSSGDFVWSLDSLTTAGFSVGVLIMLVTAASAFTFAKRMLETNKLLAHRQEVLKETEEVISEFEDLSSRERGYIITGNLEIERGREQTKADLEQNLLDVRRLTSDNPSQQGRVDQLASLISRQIDWEERLIATRREKGFLEAAGLVSTGTGNDLSVKVHSLVEEMQGEEYRLLGVDQKQAEIASTATFLVLPLGAFLSLAILSLGFFFLNSGMGERAQSEKKYRAIFENAIEGIFQSTPQGRFLSVNPAVVRMLGFDSPEELISSREDVERQGYVDPTLRQRFKKALEENGFITGFEYEVYRKDGTKIWVSENCRAVRDADGTLLYYEGTCTDITEHNRVNEVERANAAKSEFLSRMSHELRTPLNAILGFGQLLERQDQTETQRSYVGHIVKAGHHLLELINEVLDISRIESGRLQLSIEPVCGAEVLEEALNLVRTLAADRRIKLFPPAVAHPDRFVLADRQRLKQVLLNLLANAIKYTPENGSVTCSITASQANTLRISVRDTGPGISKEKLPRLFVPFDRLGAEQSGIEGTGLGLAVCQRLMQAMTGKIGVESAIGKASTFWIELPEVESPLKVLSDAREICSRQPEQGFTPGKRRLLYIEDNLSNLILVEELIAQRHDIELLTAKQGEAGLKMARFHRPDLILLDLHLPDIEGAGVISRLQADEATRHIPVIVISADATRRQIKRLLATGIRAYLTKPIDVEQFFNVIERELKATSKVPAGVAA